MSTQDQKDDTHHYVASTSELNEGDRVVIELKGREIAVFKINGKYHAIGSHCPHMGGPCAEGMLTGLFAADDEGQLAYSRENEIICCPWHGWEFDVKTGEHLGKTKKRLLTYDTKIIEGDVYVDV